MLSWDATKQQLAAARSEKPAACLKKSASCRAIGGNTSCVLSKTCLKPIVPHQRPPEFFSRDSGFAFSEERSDEFPRSPRAPNYFPLPEPRARGRRGAVTRQRHAPFPPRAWIAPGPHELPPGESVQTIRNVGLLAGIRIAPSVPLPGTAARVPTKQARDARLPLHRQSFPARSRRCQPSIP